MIRALTEEITRGINHFYDFEDPRVLRMIELESRIQELDQIAIHRERVIEYKMVYDALFKRRARRRRERWLRGRLAAKL